MEIRTKNAKLSVPIQLIEYAFHNKLIKPLAIYIFLKFYTDGKVHKDSQIFSLLKETLGIKDNRTLSKHLNSLAKNKWVGFNPESGNYFIRGFNALRNLLQLNKVQAAVCYNYNLSHYYSFFVGAVVSKAVNVQKYLSVKNRGRNSAATNNRDVAFQPNSPSPYTKPYFGLSNGIIAKILNCKQTRACQLKHQAEKDGFILVKKRFKDILTLTSKDYFVRSQLYDLNPKLKGRLKFITQKNLTIKVVEQVYDEIIPCVEIKSISKFNRAKNAA